MKKVFSFFFIIFICLNSLSQEPTSPQIDKDSYTDYGHIDFLVGFGGNISFRNYTPLYYNWMLTTNLNIHLYKPLFLMIGLDLCNNSPYQTSDMLYLGPSCRINLIKSRLNFLINISIVGLAGPGDEGVGFGIGVFLTPELKYYFNQYISAGFQLKSTVFLGGRNYYMNPIVGISLKL